MDENKIQLILEAVQTTNTALTQVIADVQKLNAINADSARAQEAVAASTKGAALQMAEYAIKVAAVVEAVRMMVRESITVPEQMERMAQAAGIDVESFSALARAANKYELETHQLSISLKLLAVATGDALRGSANHVAAFAALGISTKFLKDNENDLQAVLLKIADQFKTHADGANKAHVAQVLFGRGSQELIAFLDQGGAAISGQTEKLKEMGLVVTETAAHEAHEFNSAWKDLHLILNQSTQDFVHGFLPAITDTIKQLNQSPEIIRGVALAIGVLTDAIILSTTKMGPYIAAAQALIGLFVTAHAFGEKLGAEQWQAMSAADLEKQQRDFRARLADQVEQLEMLGKISGETAAKIQKDIVIAGYERDKDIAQKDLERLRNEIREAQGMAPVTRGTAVAGQKPQVELIEDTAGIAKDKADAQLAILKADVERRTAILKAALDDQQRDIDEAFKERSASAQDWAAKSIQIEQSRVNLEKREALSLYQAEKEAAQNTLDATTDPRARAKLRSDLLVLETNYQKQLSEIDNKASAERFKIAKDEMEKVRALEQSDIQDLARQRAEAQATYQAGIEAIDQQEKIGLINATQATALKVKAETTYLQQLEEEQKRLQKILEEMLAINRAHPGTFQDKDMAGVGALISGNKNTQTGLQSQIAVGNQSQAVTAWQTQMQKLGDTSANIAQEITGTIGTAVNAISTGIDNMILKTKNWRAELLHIGVAIYSSIIQAIVQMAVQWVVAHVIMKGVALAWAAVKSAMGWSEVAEVNAQETAKTPALATNAALASTGSFGISAVIGLAALIAVIAAVTALAGHAAGGLIQGGGSGTSDSIPARLSNREYVIRNAVVEQPGALAFLHRFNQLGMASFELHAQGGLAGPSTSVLPVTRAATEKGHGVAAAPARVNVHVAMVNTRNHQRRFMQSDGTKMVFDALAQHGNQVLG